MLCILSSAIELVRKKTNILWYSGLQRLFKIFDNNTGIHNMLKYKHNTFNRKIITKAFHKNKWYVKRNKLLDENGKL